MSMEKKGKIKGVVFDQDLGVYMEKHETLVVADLHIGYEETLEKSGIHIPRSQYQGIKKAITRMIDKYEPKRILINGDVKHEFGEALRQEWSEVLDLLTYLKERKLEITVVRGNHDNFLIPMLKRLRIDFRDPDYSINRFLFIHGHRKINLEPYMDKVDMVIAAHEHPAIAFKDELGVKYKFKCFLLGKFKGKKILVLPALSPLMSGTEVNMVEKEKLLSPILRSANLTEFKALITEGNHVYSFPLKATHQKYF